MNQEAQKYLDEAECFLSSVPQADREDILLEIKSHIFEATERSEAISDVLANLRSAQKLAQAYSLGLMQKRDKLRYRYHSQAQRELFLDGSKSFTVST